MKWKKNSYDVTLNQRKLKDKIESIYGNKGIYLIINEEAKMYARMYKYCGKLKKIWIHKLVLL